MDPDGIFVERIIWSVTAFHVGPSHNPPMVVVQNERLVRSKDGQAGLVYPLVGVVDHDPAQAVGLNAVGPERVIFGNHIVFAVSAALK